ncbi:MAG: hypothetical protein MUE90_11355 [Thermoanaerobaculales bacterium]|nr:hypothetical protein [Thermoanaerobaculales bacterium]
MAAVIRHAFAEGWLLLRQRGAIPAVLAFALAVPVALAGVGVTVIRWLGPVADLESRGATVAVLLHPRLDEGARRAWLAARAAAQPAWSMTEVSAPELAARLGRWFPYLEALVDDGDASLPALIEITTAEPESVAVLELDSDVLAIGPRSSVESLLGRAARRLAWAVAAVSVVLLAAAVLLTAVWVHLELFRHADELTIMRLVGATEGTVRGPFLVAVALPAAAAGGLAMLGTTLAVGAFARIVASLGLPALAVPTTVLAAECAAALGLPVAAALLTLARHAADEIGS